MKKNNLFVGILLVLVGFMLLFFPKRCISLVVALMGIEAVVNGIYSLVHTRKLVPDSDFQKLVFIRGTLSIVVGCCKSCRNRYDVCSWFLSFGKRCYFVVFFIKIA